MNFRTLPLIAICCLCIPGFNLAASPQVPVTIAPYGNSITQAANNHPSYRYPLWKKLIDAKIAFDFVGSMNTNFGGDPVRADYQGKKFDPDHEGHWGWRADEILNSMTGWLAKYTPDMVLFHIGSNDCIQGQTTASTQNELSQIVTKLRSDNPRVVIFMATLIPCNASASATSNVNDLNSKIKTLVGQLNTEASPVILVDQNTGIDASKDLYDGIHPGPTGEEKMAQKWFDAISKYIATTPVVDNAAQRADRRTAAIPVHHRTQVIIPQKSPSSGTVGETSNLQGKQVGKNAGEGAAGVFIISKDRAEE